MSALLDCGHAESPHSVFTCGYGVDSEGKKHCYDCCHAIDMASIQRAEPFLGYLAKDDRGEWIISNWPGQTLLRVTDHWKVFNPWVARGYTSDSMVHIRAVDEEGRAWYGRGMGEGMYCRMRPTRATMAAIKEGMA